MSLRIRRGGGNVSGGDPPIPPEQQLYGPIEGRSAIIDNAGPRTVTAPVPPYNEITTADNANFNTILTNNPGERFWVRAGTYNRLSPGTVLPKTGQTIHCEAGVIFDGGGMNANCIQVASTVEGVTWRGGKVQNVGTVASTTKYGFVLGGPVSPTTPSVLEDLEVTGVIGAVGPSPYGGFGMRVVGGGLTVRHCYSHDNGRAAMEVGASDNLTITRCKFSGNNTQGSHPGGEAGTCKAADSFGGKFNNYQFTKNYIDGDQGFGFWTDGIQPATTGVTVSENVIENVIHAGIMIELSACAVHVYRNYVFGCGGGGGTGGIAANEANRWQILISTSNGTLGAPGGILVERNIVDAINSDHRKLIGLVQHDGHGTGATTRVKGVTVRENQLWCRTGSGNVGGHDEALNHPLFSEPTISFASNAYQVASLSNANWRWGDPQGSPINKLFDEWNAYGFDQTATRTVI